MQFVALPASPAEIVSMTVGNVLVWHLRQENTSAVMAGSLPCQPFSA
jgi:hypothetical protein